MFKAIIHAPVLLALGGSLYWAAPAQAQDSETQPGASEGVADIIVSARRRAESLHDTPVAVTAIAPAQLEGAAALTIGDLQGAAPNVIITSGGTGAAAANISIRGIAFADIEKSFDPAVGVNIDGVYIGTSTGQMLDFFDIASIEVLRGPQGTLFGRNTIAGVINVKRTRPTGEWGGKFEAGIGSYDQISAKGVVNLPVAPDLLAVKLFYMHTDGSGYYRDMGRGGAHRGGTNNENYGASLLFTPSSNFDALVTVDRQEQDFDPTLGPLTSPGDAFAAYLPPLLINRDNVDGVYKTMAPASLYGKYRAYGITGEMNWRLNGVTLTSVTAYRKSTDDILQDFATNGLYLAQRDQNYHQFSQELRASGHVFSGFDYVAGLYYFNSRYHLDQYTSVFGAALTHQDATGWSESYAGFIDFNWEIFDKVRLSGGGRYTHDKKEMRIAYTDPGTPTADFSGARNSKSWSKFTPKIGLDYRPNNDLMLYASWSRGYRSGGFNGRALTEYAASLPYNPETVDAYEVGIKSEFWDRKASLNIAAFYSDYKNIQQNSEVSVAGVALPQTVVINAAAARIQGLEADFTLRPLERLTLRGSMGYIDTKFTGFIVNQPVTTTTGAISRTFDYSGVDMIYAPKITASINAEYEAPVYLGSQNGKLKLNAGYRYLSRYDQQIAADPAIYAEAISAPDGTVITVPRNDPRLRSDTQNLVDVSLSLIFNINDRAKYRLTGFVRNLLDDRGTQTSFVASAFPVYWGFATAREPRVYGIQLGFEF
ncbi:MAG: TonB-dependent receptor [Sphingomonadales bacterium]|nr:MAG: TonB-dependent receptor [Sphingomonadales bacterium]TNF06354.1 MAG: TonB-dependent receptor [Sphingomonadales bacterium]